MKHFEIAAIGPEHGTLEEATGRATAFCHIGQLQNQEKVRSV